MKKSLLAIAAMTAFAGAAQAQSSVTVYGVIDTGVANITNVAKQSAVTAGSATGTLTGVQSGGLSTPRFGMKGTEDLGGGTKANFMLEAEVLSQDGSQLGNTDALFNRASWVGLENATFGQIKLGRMDTAGYANLARMETFGGGNLGGVIAVGSYGYARIKDAVAYESPRMLGFQAIVQTGVATDSPKYGVPQAAATVIPTAVAADYNQARINQVALNYLAGPFEVWATIGKQMTGASTSANLNAVPSNATSQIFANYTVLPNLKLNASWVSTNTYSNGVGLTSAQNVTNTSFGANYDVTPVIGLDGIYTTVKSITSNYQYTPKVYGARVRYSLSKRTTLYGIVAASSQDNGSALGIANTTKFNSGYGTNATTSTGTAVGGAPAVAGVNQTGIMIGVRHTF